MKSADVDIADYLLGVMRGDRRSRLSRMAAQDMAQIESRLGALDLALAEAPPADLLDTILARIDREAADQAAAPGTDTVRHQDGVWLALSPGVRSKLLRVDARTGRRTMLIRMEPGAPYQSHAHIGGDEECLVIEGDLRFGELNLEAGDFHVARHTTWHATAVSQTGCLLLVSVG
ncbi:MULTISPECIES: cupin domain-containing protein [Nitrospirillum]|uniref:Anti-sigma factor ChrR (Cupin superfamily) n=1 Tax=Nitrospirillum amazonense TaxID=28077 RepID=A0A560FAF7_9PROT|nr:cupin domain-containing protein [Nitrospirillum amazonense]MEC4593025.1 cupin domain-containing protein [Nitrospirillum amazonense]TWB18596.1 anti-sigma factor ChrR (cupin superfamily) [Nitrospirillum amazonense]